MVCYDEIRADGGRKTITVKLDPALADELDQEAEDRDLNRSEYLRNIIDRRHEPDELQAKVEDLQNQLMAANRRIDTSNEVVEYVEDEASWRSAGLGTRVKWWLFGRDESEA